MSEGIMNFTVETLLSQTASNAPTPGGGSVGGLVGALGAALGEMVCALSVGKKSFLALSEEEQQATLAESARLSELRQKMAAQMLEDTKVFSTYMAAIKLPKETEEQKVARRQAMDAAAIGAFSAPLRMAELATEILRHLPRIAQNGVKAAISDAGCAAVLAAAAFETSLLNIRINLPAVKDETLQEKGRQMLAALPQVEAMKAAILETVQKKLEG